MPACTFSSYSADIRRATSSQKSAQGCLDSARQADSTLLSCSWARMPNLSDILGTAQNGCGNEAISARWSTEADLYKRVAKTIPIVRQAVRSISQQCSIYRARLQDQQTQLVVSQSQVAIATDRLRNVRRTIFIDTLLGQDEKLDLAIDQDPYTLFMWLKDADEAGRLSKPTAAALALAVKQADAEGASDIRT